LVGWADTGVNLTNIKVVGEIDYANPSNLYLGGIAGYLNGASLVNGSSTAATNVNIGAISIRTNYTGGAVGYGANATITGVFSIGPITIVDGAVNTSAGGVSGYTTGTTITDCHATGNISVSLQRSAMIYVGGLAGYARSGLITKSHATGNVTALTNYPYAGGLVGYNYDGNVISESYATGNVTSSGNTSTDDSYPYAGGLAGYNSSGSVAENPITTIINCYSTGDVTAQGAGDTAWAGGITGSNAYNAVISKTYATGSVTARTPHDPTSEAPNTGAIAGGIVGYNYFGAPVVEYSFALNSTITNYGRTNTYIKRHRIEGSRNDSASLISNMGSTDMVFDPAYSPPTPADPDGPDGGNTVAQPAQGDYVALGWIFTTSSTTGIWKMNTTISPYPLLQWQ
jgi:hypothetical protein